MIPLSGNKVLDIHKPLYVRNVVLGLDYSLNIHYFHNLSKSRDLQPGYSTRKCRKVGIAYCSKQDQEHALRKLMLTLNV